MLADPSLDKKEAQEERKKLDQIYEKLSQVEKQKIVENYNALDHFQTQQAQQSIECLPKVHVQDIPQEGKDFALSEEKWKNFTLYHHDCFTNQVLYVDLLFDLCDLGSDDLVLVSMLSSILTEMGTEGHSYQEVLQNMHAYTGGIGSYLSLNISSNNPKLCSPSFCIKGKALYRNTDKLFSMIKDFLTSSDLSDAKRIKELLLQQFTYLQQSLVQHAASYAVSLSYSGMDVPSYLDYQWHGIAYYYYLQDIMKDIDKNIPKLIEKLQALKERIFTFNNLHLVITCDKQHYQLLKDNHFYHLDELPEKSFDRWLGSFPIHPISSQAKTIPAPISFSSVAYDTIGYHHPDAPFLMVASSLFEHIVLHPRIREQGGAYGSGARYNPVQGKFHFFTFRDPHIYSSIDAIYASQAEIAKGLFSNEELEEAKLSIIQGIDRPIGPQNRATVAYHWMRSGLNKKARQKFRKKILEATKEEIQKAVEEHLLSLKGKEIIVSFAGKELVEKENKLLANAGKQELAISTV
jgi:Zn-dependent M16 (insulinase) family peptidase